MAESTYRKLKRQPLWRIFWFFVGYGLIACAGYDYGQSAGYKEGIFEVWQTAVDMGAGRYDPKTGGTQWIKPDCTIVNQGQQ